MMAVLASLAPLVAATSKKTTSGNPTLLIIVVIGAAFYFLIYRPQQRKAKAARAQTNTFDVGDEVLTAGGIVGHIIDIDGDRVTLETSVGASFVVLKPYVLRRLEAPVEEGDEEETEDEDLTHEQGELADGSEEPDAEDHEELVDGDAGDDDTNRPDGPTTT
ncbi:MAG: preprotein translocase subunit YajC [Acidimicrobiales bacterium]